MGNFVQYWQSVTECVVPRMAHWSMHGAVWWSIDSNYVFFVFEASNVPWKLETEEIGIVYYTLDSTLYTSYIK